MFTATALELTFIDYVQNGKIANPGPVTGPHLSPLGVYDYYAKLLTVPSPIPALKHGRRFARKVGHRSRWSTMTKVLRYTSILNGKAAPGWTLYRFIRLAIKPEITL